MSLAPRRVTHPWEAGSPGRFVILGASGHLNRAEGIQPGRLSSKKIGRTKSSYADKARKGCIFMVTSISQPNSVSPAADAGRIPKWNLFHDILVRAIAVYGALATILLLLIPKLFLPAEDSAILFQFSRNLATNGAITFIPLGARAEGATDFLWMVLIALGMKLHIDPMWLVAVVNVISILLLAALLIRIAGRRPNVLSIFFVVGAFAMMPQIVAAIGGFSTLPFTYILVAFVFCFLGRRDAAAALLGLILCLLRPDGVVFVVPLLAAALMIYPQRGRRFVTDLAFFAVPGIAYFLWRWHYFAELLPLPFLVKSNAPRIAHLFVETSLRQGRFLCLFCLVLLWFVLRGHLRGAQNRAVLLCIVVLPNLFYFAMRLDQNVGHRFFIYLPAGTAILIAMNWESTRPKAAFMLLLGLFTWLLLLSRITYAEAKYAYVFQYDNRRAIANELAQLPPGKLILSEAGIVTYYSHWSVYDPWGLNTPAFAKRLFQPSDVESIKPDLILVYPGGDNDCFHNPDWQVPYHDRAWKHMTRNLLAGAEDTGNYELWLLPTGNTRYRAARHWAGWQGDQECWLVRRGTSEQEALEAVLARHGGLPVEQYREHVPAGSESDYQLAQQTDTTHRTGLRLIKHYIGNFWRFFDE